MVTRLRSRHNWAVPEPEPEAWTASGEILVSASTSCLRLGLQNRHQLGALVDQGRLIPCAADRRTGPTHRGRPSEKFFLLRDVEAVRIEMLEALGGVDSHFREERDDLLTRIELLKAQLASPGAEFDGRTMQTTEIHLADRVVALERDIGALNNRNRQLEAAFRSGLEVQRAQLVQLESFRGPTDSDALLAPEISSQGG
jgi:hypothetical protein